ncbi:HipA domain-containing protein [Skermanella rosea]|uniref:type II toxin-antitoxin system HipA family toxin n=1 Tax=Skermanella rosea TaxID=1817965 RepID=UPI001932D78E|nr:HipA domain-containing protein [Skermanella rosea]UEM01276.1 HipA domain-containing protein [Skermanella rosea]
MTAATITLQLHHHGAWHDAAVLDVKDAGQGIDGASALSYELDYFIEWGAVPLADDLPLLDYRALSVQAPVDLEFRSAAHWPAFLLDLLPQGHARRRLATALGFQSADGTALDFPLLLRGAGCPVGNIRVKEAWEQECRRLEGQVFQGLETGDVLRRTDRFLDAADRFALIASGSSGVQGEWPKVLLTRSIDGLWYPDPLVNDQDASAHAIVKLSRARSRADLLILAAEAPYLEVAREFGLRVANPLVGGDHVLMIPRFDRRVRTGARGPETVRLGQESIVSAAGVAQFGYLAAHEEYLGVIKRFCSEPAAEVTEYVLRDVLNLAMGNPDNHGRNTALQKAPDGWIGLSPLFDFAPMRLDPGGIVRATRWACLGRNDLVPDWRAVCGAAAEGVMAPEDLMAALAAKEQLVRALPGIARRHGVNEEVIDGALGRAGEIADGLAELSGSGHAPR